MIMRRSIYKGFALIEILVVVAIIAIFTGGGLWYAGRGERARSTIQMGLEAERKAEDLARQIQTRNRETVDEIGDTPSVTEGIDTSTWKTYRNEEYGFEVRYPSLFFRSTKYDQNGILLLGLGETPGVQRMAVSYYKPQEGDITQTKEMDKILAWLGEFNRSHLIREAENPKLYHFYKEKGGFIDEDVIVVEKKTGNIIIFAIERTTGSNFPTDTIVQTLKFAE